MTNRPGSSSRRNAAYQVANLASLFTVCALALNDLEEWNDEIRKSATKDIKLVLELGAVLADEACVLTEKQIAEAEKAGGRK